MQKSTRLSAPRAVRACKCDCQAIERSRELLRPLQYSYKDNQPTLPPQTTPRGNQSITFSRNHSRHVPLYFFALPGARVRFPAACSVKALHFASMNAKPAALTARAVRRRRPPRRSSASFFQAEITLEQRKKEGPNDRTEGRESKGQFLGQGFSGHRVPEGLRFVFRISRLPARRHCFLITEKGAFTVALMQKQGRFELADRAVRANLLLSLPTSGSHAIHLGTLGPSD